MSRIAGSSRLHCMHVCYSDRHELVGLEQLLASNREKEFQAQLAVQESSSEVQLMRDRLTLNDSKMYVRIPLPPSLQLVYTLPPPPLVMVHLSMYVRIPPPSSNGAFVNVSSSSLTSAPTAVRVKSEKSLSSETAYLTLSLTLRKFAVS